MGAVGGVGLALLLVMRPPAEPRGGVLLNPHPPQAPTRGLQWDLWKRPSSVPDGEPGGNDAPEDGADAYSYADAGIWATPAEFSDSD